MLATIRPAVARLSVRAFSTSRPAADIAKMTLIGRIGGEPQIKVNKNGKEFLMYKVATTDPFQPPKDGVESEKSTSWHTIFAYGTAIDRLKSLEKGSLVHVEASFRIVNAKDEDGDYSTSIFATHERMHVIRRPQKEAEEVAEA
ncbi:hypothetical protein T439DRAFT_188352 [Meredithblackwellia eburnea MCA 4105]